MTGWIMVGPDIPVDVEFLFALTSLLAHDALLLREHRVVGPTWMVDAVALSVYRHVILLLTVLARLVYFPLPTGRVGHGSQ